MNAKLMTLIIRGKFLHNRGRAGAKAGWLFARGSLSAQLLRVLAAALFALTAQGARAAVVLNSLHSFMAFTNGAFPTSALVPGPGGNFYGTAGGGGTNGGWGTVFRISTNGALATLYPFTGGNDGGGPNGLVLATDGNFYGTTYDGGTSNWGTVFKISTNGTLTSLYSFTGGDDGANPSAALVQGSDGNFYGTTYDGGPYAGFNVYNGYGTIFKISATGVLTNLYYFTGGDDGGNPADVLVASGAYLYGTTQNGGTNGAGNVFKISTSGAWSDLYSFTGGNDGLDPMGLAPGTDGNFYGTAYGGGSNNLGTVFKISPAGSLAALYSFTGGTNGANPGAALAQSGGIFYGTTLTGGTSNWGTVFKITTNGALTRLYSFTGGTNGASPAAALATGSDGNLYGTTSGDFYISAKGAGTVFRISPAGAESNLYSFPGVYDGFYPAAELAQGRDGDFYGTTEKGGTNGGYGTVFKMDPNGVLTSLYSFTGDVDGWVPNTALAQNGDGNFYGTTLYGGSNSWGTVFRITTNGVLTKLHSFTHGFDGGYPAGALIPGTDGNFYSTAGGGGTNGHGIVYRINTNGAVTDLYSFTGGNDGANPGAGLVLGTDGKFYGTTQDGGTNGQGTVFSVTTNGTLKSLYSFSGGVDGANPGTALVPGPDGNFYGTTYEGGAYTNQFYQQGNGTVFKISQGGSFASVYSFTGGNDGATPEGPLVRGSDGYLYGTTYAGGANGWGGVFRLSTNGMLTNLYAFTGGNDGANPESGLIQGTGGSFYGTTYGGGMGGSGTVFRLTMVPEFEQVTLSNRTLNLTWSTEVGGKYQLQFNPGFTSATWTNVGASATASGSTLSGADSVTNGARRVYRVMLQP